VTVAAGPWSSTPFRRLVSARTIGMFGNAVAPIALAFAVLDLHGSGTDLGIVVGSRSAANVVLLLFGGVLADRLPRQLVLVGSSVAAGLTQAAVAAAVLTRTDSIALLAALSAVNGAVSAFAMPAGAALLPQTVPPEQRQQANALARIGTNTALVLGASSGGLLVVAVGSGWGIAVDATTFLVAAVLYAGVHAAPAAVSGDTDPPADSGPPDAPGVWAELAAGWTEFSSRTWLWAVVAAFMVVNAAVTGGLGVLGPLVADATFGRAAWGFVLAAQTLGLVLGGLIALRLRVRRLLRFGTAMVAAEALPLLALGLHPVVPVLIGAAFLAGIALEQFGIAWDTTLQQHIPTDRLARVYSYDMLGSFLAIPAGQVAAGPLAAAFGLRTTLVGAAAVVLAATAAALTSTGLRRLTNTALTPAGGGAAVHQPT